MVSVAVSKMGVNELMFVDPGVKVNSQYYRNVLHSADYSSHQTGSS